MTCGEKCDTNPSTHLLNWKGCLGCLGWLSCGNSRKGFGQSGNTLFKENSLRIFPYVHHLHHLHHLHHFAELSFYFQKWTWQKWASTTTRMATDTIHSEMVVVAKEAAARVRWPRMRKYLGYLCDGLLVSCAGRGSGGTIRVVVQGPDRAWVVAAAKFIADTAMDAQLSGGASASAAVVANRSIGEKYAVPPSPLSPRSPRSPRSRRGSGASFSSSYSSSADSEDTW